MVFGNVQSATSPLIHAWNQGWWVPPLARLRVSPSSLSCVTARATTLPRMSGDFVDIELIDSDGTEILGVLSGLVRYAIVPIEHLVGNAFEQPGVGGVGKTEAVAARP